MLGSIRSTTDQATKIKNMACHVINNLRKHDHVLNEMRDLHWLKIPEHIQYKVLIITYQCMNDLVPSLITDLLDLDLRSDTQGMLPMPCCSLSEVRDSSIRFDGPGLWNRILQHIKNSKTLEVFKTKLKTSQFAKCYGLN